jgi:tRNA pseudouridine38-40 synthase
VASARVSFAHDTATLVRALNAQLPEAVRVLSAEDAPPGFHARLSARRKTYRYEIRNAPVASPFERAFVWHVPQELALRRCKRPPPRWWALTISRRSRAWGATHLVASARSSRPRSLPRDRLVSYEVTGDGFLRHMVRAIVGTLVEVGRGWREPANLSSLLAPDAAPTPGQQPLRAGCSSCPWNMIRTRSGKRPTHSRSGTWPASVEISRVP